MMSAIAVVWAGGSFQAGDKPSRRPHLQIPRDVQREREPAFEDHATLHDDGLLPPDPPAWEVVRPKGDRAFSSAQARQYFRVEPLLIEVAPRDRVVVRLEVVVGA